MKIKQIVNDLKWSRCNPRIFFKRRNARRIKEFEINRLKSEIILVSVFKDFGIEKELKIALLYETLKLIQYDPLPSYIPKKQRGGVITPIMKRDDVRPC